MHWQCAIQLLHVYVMHGMPVEGFGASDGQPPATPDISGSVSVRIVSDFSESFTLDRFFMPSRDCNGCTNARYRALG